MFEPIAALAGYGLGRAFGSKQSAPENPNKHYTPGGIRYNAGDIDSAFTQILGREPTAVEKQYFGTLLENGEIRAGEIPQFLQSYGEAQQRLLDTQTGQLEQRLGANDTTVLGRAADVIQGRLAAQGRSGSSGYTAAFANAARDLGELRQQQVTSFYGGGLGDIRRNVAMQGQSQVQRSRSIADQQLTRGQSIEDYYRQQNDYQNQMRQQSTQNLQSSLLGAGLGIIGSGASGYFGGLGYAKGLGQLAGNYNAQAQSLGGPTSGVPGGYSFAPQVPNFGAVEPWESRYLFKR